MAETTGPSWSDIPLDLAGRILRHLPAYVDRLRFAAVCPEWRGAARQGGLPPSMPLLLLPDSTVYSLPRSKPLHFPACTGYTGVCGTGNWLVFLKEDGCLLRDPFSNETVTLPALSRARLQDVGDESSDEAGHTWIEMDQKRGVDASKIMFCSPHLIAAIFRFKRDSTTRIAVCKPGASSWWYIYMNYQAPQFADIVFHQGKLYALDCLETLFAVAISIDQGTGDPWVSQIQQVIGGRKVFYYDFLHDFLNLRVTFLVESRGVLLLVCRKIDLWSKIAFYDAIEALETEQSMFEVYEGNFGQSRWTKVTTLGDDQVLFLSRQCCRSVSISHNEMPGDRIIFMENDEEYYLGYRSEASSSCRVYDMRDGKVSTPLPVVSWKLGKVFTTWLLPAGLN
nr:unnamed protein product [Digitaria exilis]CAB3504265.1 unnamed protein product [Digitaria exilis]